MAGTHNRGFASMDPSKQKEIASKGGRAAHAAGTAHEFTSDEARAAGRKGGQAVSRDRAHMSAIGRRGGESSHGGRRGLMVTPGLGAGRMVPGIATPSIASPTVTLPPTALSMAAPNPPPSSGPTPTNPPSPELNRV